MQLHNKTILLEKLKESLSSVLPITVIVFLLCFTIIPVPNDILMAFVVGACLLVLGMGLFTMGTDIAMTPIGSHVGSAVTKSKKIGLILFIGFLVGSIITISEPDLQVLAEQVPNIPNTVIIAAVALGVGIFVAIGLLRTFFKINLNLLLIIFYLLIFVLAIFVPQEFLAVAFDSGGVTTGPMTVPFIMGFGSGVAAMLAGRDSQDSSFGLVAFGSIGPILAVMLLGLIYRPDDAAYTPVEIPQLADSRELWSMFGRSFPEYMKEVLMALLPIILFFFLFQVFILRLKRAPLIRITVGLIYTYVGLFLFLTGVNVGFMPVGNYIGQQLGALSYNWIVIPIGAVIGFFIVQAEPAVHVLNRQVYEITSGAIPKKAISMGLSIGVCISVALSMLRIITQMNIMYLLVPGYAIALILTFFCPPLFTAIAFDSGGVASGAMTATFLLPLAMGVCISSGGNIVTDAFGVVAMVAMTPLITIQIIGIYFKHKSKNATLPDETVENEKLTEDDVILE